MIIKENVKLKKAFVAIYFLIVMILCGCSVGAYNNPYVMSTAGAVGCPPEEVKMTNVNGQIGIWSWKAECRGKSYYCSQVYNQPTQCTPEVQQSK